jgi:uncharacterized protein YndB with AHSA1/START domain
MAGRTKKAQQSEVALEIRRTFPARRERVFRAWTQPEELNRWSAPGPLVAAADVDLRVGGRYRIVMQSPDGTAHIVGGVYRVVDAPSRLVYTWSWENAAREGDSLVTVEFLERGPSTEVVLRHERLADSTDRDRHREGWIGCLDKLSALLNT